MAIPKFLTLQFQGNYRGPMVLPQGKILPFWTVNIGAKKELFNNKATISLNVSDIFKTGIFRIKTEDDRFKQNRTFSRETQVATLSFTYRFGGFQEKRNNRQERRETEEEMDF